MFVHFLSALRNAEYDQDCTSFAHNKNPFITNSVYYWRY